MLPSNINPILEKNYNCCGIIKKNEKEKVGVCGSLCVWEWLDGVDTGCGDIHIYKYIFKWIDGFLRS